MYSLVQKRRWYYAFSLSIILIGVVIMVYSLITRGSAFELSIDFKGGSIYELKFTQPGADENNIRAVFANYGDATATIQRLGDAADNSLVSACLIP
jgi:preprotein translocase subunit SecF